MACMAQYEPGQAVEQFGDVRFEEDLAAVRKQSCLLPYSGLREEDDQSALYSNGNSLSLLNTRVRRRAQQLSRHRGSSKITHPVDNGRRLAT